MSKLFKIENFDSDAQLNINTNYANNYSNWRQKEELHKLKAWYGEDIEFSVKSSEEFNESSEDDEGNEIPEQVEKNFYKTLAYLKNKDPKIYDKNIQFFTEQNNILSNELQVKEKKEKSIFLRDYERKMIIERGGNFSDSEHEIENLYNESCNITYVKEQEKIKETFKKVLQVDNEIEDILLKPKIKTKEESQKENRDYKEWLEGQEKNINEEEKKVLKPLRDFWTNPNLDENEKFLRDYVLHKRFLDKGSKDFDLSCENINHNLDENLSEDEHCITEQEEFEYKYNFRFEEPDQEFIKRYPRTLENSLRKKNTRRAEKRVELKIRKRQKNVKNQEELKQLKALKRKEIEAKLKKLKEITGNNDLQFNKLDLEEDFDPDEYDMKMSQIFNDEYYTEQTDTKKPEFPDLDRELNIEFNCNLTTTEIIQDEIPYNKAPHCEDAEFNMDADYDDNEKIRTKLVLCNKKKRKRCGKFFEMISKEKPKFDPTQYSSYKQYYDQYYALDYEDIIGDLPCRFKYRQVIPNDYGLTIEEILMADDKELNKWCPLRKAFEYKPEYKELNDVKIYKQKSNNEVLKRKILTSLYKNSRMEKEIPVVHQREEQDISRIYKCKRETQKIDKEIISNVIKKEDNFNIKNLSKNRIELDKLNKYNNIQNCELEEIFDESLKLKLSLKKNQINNKGQSSNKGNKCFTQHSQSTIDQKQLNVKGIENFTEQLNNVYQHNLYKKKSKNESTKNDKLKKRKKRLQQIKKFNKKLKVNNSNNISLLSIERFKAYGVNPKKFINKIKYLKKN